MALLPFFRRDHAATTAATSHADGRGGGGGAFPPPDWDLSPWRDLDHRLGEFGGAGDAPRFPHHFRSHVGGILRDMDNAISRMDEQMRKVMWPGQSGQSVAMTTGGGGYDPGSLLADLHTVTPSITTERDGRRMAHYDFDVSGFRPEEITVKTQDNQLEVVARHEERSPGREVSREFKRTFTIPEGIHPDELQGRLVNDGLLRVEAPYRPAGLTARDEPYAIPIEHQFMTDNW